MKHRVPIELRQKRALESVLNALQLARQKGIEGAAEKLAQISETDSRRSGLHGLCGGAHIEVRFDGRTRLGRQLRIAAQQLSYFSISDVRGGNAYLHIRRMHNRQERDVDVAAHSAALDILKNELRIVGRVKAYFC